MVSAEQEQPEKGSFRRNMTARRISERLKRANWLSQATLISTHAPVAPASAQEAGYINVNPSSVVIVIEDETTQALPAGAMPDINPDLNLDDALQTWSQLSKAEQEAINAELNSLYGVMALDPEPQRPLVEYSFEAYQILLEPELFETLVGLETHYIHLERFIQWLENITPEDIENNPHLDALLGEKREYAIAALRYWRQYEASRSVTKPRRPQPVKAKTKVDGFKQSSEPSTNLTEFQKLILNLKHLKRLEQRKLEHSIPTASELLAKSRASTQNAEGLLLGSMYRNLLTL